MIKATSKLTKEEIFKFRRKSSKSSLIIMGVASVILFALGILELVLGEILLGVLGVVIGALFTPSIIMVTIIVQNKYLRLSKMTSEGSFVEYEFDEHLCNVKVYQEYKIQKAKAIPYSDFLNILETKTAYYIETSLFSNLIVTKDGIEDNKGEELSQLLNKIRDRKAGK